MTESDEGKPKDESSLPVTDPKSRLNDENSSSPATETEGRRKDETKIGMCPTHSVCNGLLPL